MTPFCELIVISLIDRSLNSSSQIVSFVILVKDGSLNQMICMNCSPLDPQMVLTRQRLMLSLQEQDRKL